MDAKEIRESIVRSKTERMVAETKAQALLNNSEVPARGGGSQSYSYCGEYGHYQRKCRKQGKSLYDSK